MGASRSALRRHVTRPRPTVWSPVEYACHVRDVHRLYDERLAMMLAEDDPEYPNWDQDETAIEQRYHEQDPADGAAPSCRARPSRSPAASRPCQLTSGSAPGRRSDGAVFTVDTFARYYLHDIVHHIHDVSSTLSCSSRTRRRAARGTSGRHRARSAVVRNAMISARRGSSVEFGPA